MNASALLVVPADSPAIVIGGLLPIQRWERALAELGVAEVDRVPVAGLAERLRDATGPVVLALADHVVDHETIERTLEACDDATDGEVLWPTVPGLPPPPLAVLTPSAAHALADAPTVLAASVATSLDAWVAPDRRRHLAFDAGHWSRPSDAREAADTRWRLLQRLQWRPGGLVAKFLNRPLSIRVSRLLVETRVTPNQTTVFAFLIGVVGAALLFRPGWAMAVAGTFLLHVNSVLDGVDGELARMRYQRSEFGAYLDSVCDELLNAATLIGAGYHLHLDGGPMADLHLALGVFAGVVNFVYASTHWHCKLRHGLGFYWWFEAYKPRKQVQRSTSPFSYFKKLFTKDGLLLGYFVAAMLGVMGPLLWVSAIAAAAVAVLLFVHVVVFRARW